MPGAILTVLELGLVIWLSHLLTAKGIPRLYVAVMRRLGFKARMTPITLRRVARFRRIRRGYWSFRVITTAFVISLFLELLVNRKALVVYYDGEISFPAVADWLDGAIFFAEIRSFRKKSDFGQAGESEVDYRRFREDCRDPSTLRAEVGDLRTKLEEERAQFEKESPPPGPDASDFQKRKHKRGLDAIRKKAETLAQMERALAIFEAGRAWCVMPIYPYSPSDLRHDLDKNPPNSPSLRQGIPLGTDVSGRDVLALLLYGFRISIAFALIVSTLGYVIGIVVGGIQGYYGGWIDILSQRFVEIWGSIPFLFMIMILASLVTPTFLLLAVLLVVLRSWLGITFYVRGEFYREKAKDYVQAAIGAGVSDWKIIVRHILPNSLVPVVTFAPFGIVAYIGSLVSLDYLGFGLPPGTPSWGALLRQGLENVKYYPHLTLVPVAALAITLYMVVMIGEAVREAFDPKVFSRLR